MSRGADALVCWLAVKVLVLLYAVTFNPVRLVVLLGFRLGLCLGFYKRQELRALYCLQPNTYTHIFMYIDSFSIFLLNCFALCFQMVPYRRNIATGCTASSGMRPPAHAIGPAGMVPPRSSFASAVCCTMRMPTAAIGRKM